MAKTIRQRKDELIGMIRAKKQEPVPVSNVNQYDEYRKILFTNGIRNERLIKAQLDRMISEGLPKPTVYSNLKFMSLFRSRLAEEGIPLKDAEIIMEFVSFNMTDINEDDDYIGDVALEYAELCKYYYDHVRSVYPTNDLLEFKQFTQEPIAKIFAAVELKLPL